MLQDLLIINISRSFNGHIFEAANSSGLYIHFLFDDYFRLKV